MIATDIRKTVRWLVVIVLTGSMAGGMVVFAQDDDASKTEEIPEAVMTGLMEKFPKAEIRAWTKETEGDTVVFDIEFIQEDRNFEADILVDGSIHNWEKEITAKDLPTIVWKRVLTDYPGSTPKEIMEIAVVRDGKDITEGYELVLEIAAGEYIEITIAPDGDILEEDALDEE